MNSIEENLSIWKMSLPTSIPIAGLLSRSPIVYKWKAPFRAWMLREVLFWRVCDLLSQSYALHQREHILGARVLLRSSIESISILVYLNDLMQGVIRSKLNFHDFGKITSTLLMGSRDGSTDHSSTNIMTIIQKSEKKYPGIERHYATLSESAHPNFEGMVVGYSKVDRNEYETHFSNRWMELYGKSHLDAIELCMRIFHHEYNDVWATLIEKLEEWIEANDAELEATRADPKA